MQQIDLTVNNKKLGRIYLHLDYSVQIQNHRKFAIYLANQVKPQMGFGYAGFSHRKFLAQKLEGTLFDNPGQKIAKLNISRNMLISLIRKNIGLAYAKLPIGRLNIYVFPHFSEFINKQMGGVSGTTIWENTMILFVNPARDWEKYLGGTIVHEYNHSVAFNNYRWSTLLDKMVIEGLAEVFLDEVLPKPPLKVGETIGYKQSTKLLNKLKPKLNDKGSKIYNEVFYDKKNTRCGPDIR